jgi:TrpR family transcriptional regulator, trp operon repressor
MHRNSSRPRAGDFAEVAAVFASITDPEAMKAFLEEILSPAERSSLVMRWKLLRMLHLGVPQREIAGKLHLSLCKITRGSRILKRPKSISRALLSSASGKVDST